MTENVFDEWDELTGDYKELEATNKIYQVRLEELDEYQRKCQKSITHQRYRMGIITKSLVKLKKTG